MAIIVKTQVGNRGPWATDYRAVTGPANLLKAVKAARESASSTRAVGGYRTVLTVDGKTLDPTDWPSSLAEAREVLAA